MGKGGRGEGRPASGDRSSKREERETDSQRQREMWEVGRALLKGKVVNLHMRCS